MMEDNIVIFKWPNEVQCDFDHFIINDPELVDAIKKERKKMKGYGIDVFYHKHNMIITEVGCFIAFQESYARELYDKG